MSVEVIDLRTLAPLDREGIVSSVEKTGRAVVIHEAPLTGGLGGEIVATIPERALYSLRAPVRRVAGWDTIFPLKRSEHHYLPIGRSDRRSRQRDFGGLSGPRVQASRHR